MDKKTSFTNITEKTISSELVYKGFLTIYKDQVELPNGKQTSREFIKHPGAAMIIPVLANGNLLMIEQYRHAVGKIFLEFPAGKTDSGENSEQAAHRELAEEVGYQSAQLKYLTSIHPVIGYSNEQIDLYVAHDLKPAMQNHQDDEFLILKEVSVSELQKMVERHEITDVKTQIGFFWYQNSLSVK